MLLFETTRHSVPFNFPPTDYTDDNISYSKKLDSKTTKKKKKRSYAKCVGCRL